MVRKNHPPMKRAGGRYQVPALARGLHILEFLASSPDGSTVSDVAAYLKLPKPSAFRMMVTLAEQGYLLRDGDGSIYRLSRKMLSLGYAAVDALGLVERSMDVLRKLRDVTHETALIAVLSGNEGIVLEQAPSTHAVKVLVEVGHRFPLHTAAPGKAILAFLPEGERDAILDSLVYEKFTQRTITSRNGMLMELENVRKNGAAYDRGEELDDLRCVGAAVLDGRGYPLAAIWISGPSSRINDSDLTRFSGIVTKHAKIISERFSQ